MKTYPRLLLAKLVPDCECRRCRIELPWRVREIRYEGDPGLVLFKSVEFESARAHVAYMLSPKPKRQRLTLTLDKH